MCVRPPGSLDSPAPTASPFPTGVAGFSSATVRRSVAQAVSSSHRLRASSQCFTLGSAPIRADIQAGSRRVRLPWSSRFLITTSVARIVAAPALPAADAFRPRRSSRPRRFAPRSTLRVYFAPQPLPGFTLQGISLPHSHDASATPLCLHDGSTALATRVAPCATYAAAACKALLHVEVRCQDVAV